MDEETREALQKLSDQVAQMRTEVVLSGQFGLTSIVERLGRLEEWVHDLEQKLNR